MKHHRKLLCALMALVCHAVIAAPLRDAVPPDAADVPLNYRLHVEFSAPGGGAVRLGKDFVVPLAKGAEHDVAVEHPAKGAPVLRLWSGGSAAKHHPLHGRCFPAELRSIGATPKAKQSATLPTLV